MQFSSAISYASNENPQSSDVISIVAVVVIYKTTFDQSATLTSLQEALHPGSTMLELTTLVVDNSPAPPRMPENLPPKTHYLSIPENLGLANAYNRGIQLAQQIGASWLLTLDQDTYLPRDFLVRMIEHARQLEDNPSIAAILPRILAGDEPLSPLFFRWQTVPTFFAPGYTGVTNKSAFGINSGSLLRVDALEQIGGYDPLFWLDCSDMQIFDRLHALGKRIFVAGDLKLQHELSIKDMQSRLSPIRYRHMLLAESAFWDAAMPPTARLERTARLALRFVKQIFQRQSISLSLLTLRFLTLRLFRSSSYRKRLFVEASKQHLGGHLSQIALPPRAAKVSICMASYNSGHYIELQLGSILPQLTNDDEVVIVDDSSTDNTRQRIRSFANPRIRLIENQKNEGVICAFEKALRAATGDLLFLSDHDDLWAPNKVQLFKEAFSKAPQARIVMSAVSLIDSDGRPFREPRWDRDGKRRRGFFRNIIKNSYQGSALAIRSDLLTDVLPLPPDRLYLHDQWIGTVNDRRGGEVVFLDEPLLLYRRHTTNLSRTQPFGKRVLSRIQLLCDHVLHSVAKLWLG